MNRTLKGKHTHFCLSLSLSLKYNTNTLIHCIALEKQTKQALERIPLSPFPSDAVACLFPASAELGQQEELKKTVGLDSKVYVSLSKCFEKWSEMPKLTENFWKELNAWYVSNKEAHCNLQPQQTILAICLRDIEMGNIDAGMYFLSIHSNLITSTHSTTLLHSTTAMCFLKLCRINGSQAYGVMSMGMFKSLFRLLRPAHRAKEDEDEMDQDTKQVDEEDEEENLSSTFDPMLTDLMKEIRLTLFGKDNTRIGSEIGLLNSLAETILTNVLQYKKEHKLSKLFYKHAGKTLKCIVSSATQVLSTGSSGEKENVVTENCADLLVRLLPIVMMVKFGMSHKFHLYNMPNTYTHTHTHIRYQRISCADGSERNKQDRSVLDTRSDSNKSKCRRSLSSKSMCYRTHTFRVS